MLTILGGGGWLPAHGRHTACALVRRGSSAIMIDAGTGLARAIERPELFEGVERLEIVLTHFHLDHLVGLAYLSALPARDVAVWGPGEVLYGAPTHAVLDKVWHEPFHPVPLAEQGVSVRDVPAGEFELFGVRVATRRQDRHTAPTLGLRLDDELAWITDTAYDADSASFAEGCSVVAHEAWFVRGAPRNPEIHSAAGEAAQVAVDAGAERLLLIHLPPFEPSVEGLVAEASGAGVPEVVAALDGAEVRLSSGRDRR